MNHLKLSIAFSIKKIVKLSEKEMNFFDIPMEISLKLILDFRCLVWQNFLTYYFTSVPDKKKPLIDCVCQLEHYYI